MGSANNDLYSQFLLCIHRNCLKTTTKKRGGGGRGGGSRHRLSPLKFERKVSETKVEGEKERLSLVSLHSFCLFSPCTWTFPHAQGLFPMHRDFSPCTGTFPRIGRHVQPSHRMPHVYQHSRLNLPGVPSCGKHKKVVVFFWKFNVTKWATL